MKKAKAPKTIEWASIAAYCAPCLDMVSPRVARAIEGAAPNNPAKLFGRKMSPMIANKLTTIPPMRNLITNSLIDCPLSFN
jgi:hypothetical protein